MLRVLLYSVGGAVGVGASESEICGSRPSTAPGMWFQAYSVTCARIDDVAICG